MSKSIASVLALAVTTSLALANGGGGGGGDDDKKANPYQSGSVSWKPGTGITLADSDEFSLKWANQLQLQWTFTANDNAPDISDFSVRRARIYLTGNAFNRDLIYKLSLDAVDDGGTSAGPVKDAWVQYAFSKSESGTIGVRVGQSKSYHGLESTTSDAGQYFVERSAASRIFADVRSQGAWAHGSHNENKIRWNAGFQNGEVANGAGGVFERGEETNNADNALNIVGNISFDPMGDITGGKDNEALRQGDFGDVKDTMGTVGGGIEIGNNRNLANTQDIDTTQININTAWMLGGGITVQGEVFLRSDDLQAAPTEDSHGWYAMGTYTMPKSGNSEIQWGFGFRINSVDTDSTNTVINLYQNGSTFTPVPPGDVTEITGVVDAFYHGHAMKTQLEYTFQDANPDAGTSSSNHIFRVQFQLLF
jgi:hypothetical protein